MLDIITYTLYTIYKVRDRRSREKGENKMTNLINEIRENNTLEQLQEVGYIDIDSVQGNLNDFIEALCQVTGKEYKISSEVGKTVIREVK